ncbi:hypothetical protein GEMRC1_009113 [Eukaryota sp. GEM-RC1]
MSLTSTSPNTLSTLQSNTDLHDQTIIFNGESFSVIKSVIASNSQYFFSLWFMEFGDRYENPLDFSHLPISSDSFSAFISSFFGNSINLTSSNVYDIFYFATYFQCPHLETTLMEILPSKMTNWDWCSKFLKKCVEQEDLRGLKFVGEFLNEIENICQESEFVFPFVFLQSLLEFCTSSSSFKWFLKSLVASVKSETINSEELSEILTLVDVNLLTFKDWDELFLNPLENISNMEELLMKFELNQLRPICFESLISENLTLKEQLVEATELIKKKDEEIFKLKEIVEKQVECAKPIESSVLPFSSSLKHENLNISNGGKTVTQSGPNGTWKNVLSKTPLLSGNVYKVRARNGTPSSVHNSLMFGIIPRKEFDCSGGIFQNPNAHCFRSRTNNFFPTGFSNGIWLPNEIIEITINLVNNSITVAKESDPGFNCTREISSLDNDNYHLVGCLRDENSVLELL